MAPNPLRWQVLLAGVCSLILTVGLARFAYTPLLPIMRSQTWLTEVAGGWLATVNYAGYMSGALLAASSGSLPLKFRLYRMGLVLAVASLALMGLTDNLWLWVALRYLAGLASAAGLLIGSGLVLNWMIRQGHRPELGLHFGGLGLGIVVSGVAVALMAPWLDWSGQWVGLGVFALAFLLPAWAWLPAPASGPAAAAAASAGVAPQRRWMLLLIAAYFCAGWGFVISATFTVSIVERVPALAGYGSLVWVLVGVAATPACFVWERVSRVTGDVPALLLAFAVQIASILLPALSDRADLAVLSAWIYGGSFIGIVSLTLTLIGRCYPANPSKAMARLTLSYGVAQIVAPALTGFMVEASGSYRSALLLAALVMGLGMGCLWAMRRPGGGTPVTV